MSPEIIEAVFRHSHKYRKQLMLICSRNQVDESSGYVFTTQQYVDYIAKMERKYAKSNVIVCRDHCGPGFGADTGKDLDGTKNTIRCDLEHGFDLIHIDLCLAQGMSHEDKICNTLDLMRYARDILSDVMFEIGTDENIGVAEVNIDRIVADINRCQNVANPTFYVVQTGSLVYEVHNAGSFGAEKVRDMHQALQTCGTKLKEHNADYLTTKQIIDRNGIVDAVNIAPQLGVVQTSHVLSKALLYGIDAQPFISEVVHGGEWEKWSDSPNNHHLCALVAGHYHFNGPEYRYLIDKLALQLDIRESIIGEITEVIEHYLFALD